MIEFLLVLMFVALVLLVILSVSLKGSLDESRIESDFWRVRYLSTLPSVSAKGDAIQASQNEIDNFRQRTKVFRK